MDRFTKMGASLYTMPGFVPGILGCIIMVLGATLIWRSWRRSRSLAGSITQPVLQPATQPIHHANTLFNQRIVLALPLCLVYAAGLIGLLPFWLATALFIGVFTYCFAPKEIAQSKRILSSISSGVITTAVVIGVFQYIFLVRLP
jgi:hypothetical protein